jgi:uncharacterized delta-60 repeat protein
MKSSYRIGQQIHRSSSLNFRKWDQYTMSKLLWLLLFVLSCTNLLAQSGSTDNSFGINGKVTAGFGRSEAYSNTMAVQPDGKILCAGMAYTANTNREYEGDSYNAVIFRYNTDGSPDTSFGNNGMVMSKIESATNEGRVYTGIYYIKLLSDGKFLTYGFRGLNSQMGILLLCRYHADGSIDTSFGNNGCVESYTSPIGGGTPVVIQPDNKILLLGADVNSITNSVLFHLERYNADGGLDSTFAIDGQVVTTFGYLQNFPANLALQDDGKIIVSGVGNSRILMARYTSNGALDNSFDGDGKVVTAFGLGSGNSFLRVMVNGKIQVAGLTTTSTSTNFSITQYNTNGSLDLTFDSDGRTLAPFDANENSYFINSIAQQSDGKFLVTTQTVAANYFGNTEDFVTRRYNSDGAVDTTFGDNGKVSTAIQVGSHVTKCVIAQADSKILVAGYSNYLLQSPATTDFNVLRYNGDGTLDSAFSGDGIVSDKIESSNDNGRIVLEQTDGKLLLIGVTRNNSLNTIGNSDIAMSRYDQDGSLDVSFGVQGKSITVFEQNLNYIRKAALQPDGKILVANEYYSFPSSNGQEVIRFNSNGSLDSTFGTNGKISISSSFASPLLALHVQADGSFFVINHGYNPIDNSGPFALYITHFNSNGSVNTTFGVNGTTYIEGIFYSNPDPEMVFQPDGKIIIGLSEQSSGGMPGFRLIRLNGDGTIDTGFENEVLVIDITSYCQAIFMEPDGKIILAGTSTVSDGFFVSYNFVTARYNIDGSLDLSYGTNGIYKTFLGDQVANLYTVIKSILRQPDGKFLVGLARNEQYPASIPFELYDFVLYRFNTQGEYDNDFGVGGKIFTSFFGKYDEIFSMLLQPDNKIVLAGTTDNGITRDFVLARLENCINVTSQVDVNLCSGESYTLNNQSYSETGIYNATLTSAGGCDSTVTLNLTILPLSASAQNIELCSGESWIFNGENYSESGAYQTTLTSANGCDSTITLNLTILSPASSAQSIDLCAGESLTINGEIYTESGIYQTIYSDINGCDSILTTTLFIDNLQAQISTNDQDLSAIDYPEDATFQWLDCNNNFSPLLGEINSIFTPEIDGSYALMVSNSLCSATSSCEEFTVTGIPSLSNGADWTAVVFPNPFRDIVSLKMNNSRLPLTYTLLDNMGRQILNEGIYQETTVLPLNRIASGVYSLKLIDAYGKQTTIKLIKE